MSVLRLKDRITGRFVPVIAIKGETGDAAGFGTVEASVDANYGTPSVEVTASGEDTAKNFSFAFHNLKQAPYNDSDLRNQIATERSRIDSFTHLAEGSTTGDAELIDGRTGADGVTYTNIGTANRTQFSNLKSALLHSFTDTSFFKQGTLNGATGAENTGTTRLITKGYLDESIDSISPINGYKFILFAYASDGTYIGRYNGSGFDTSTILWLTSAIHPKVINSTYKYKIMCAKSNDATIEASDATNIIFSSANGLSEDESATIKTLNPAVFNGLITYNGSISTQSSDYLEVYTEPIYVAQGTVINFKGVYSALKNLAVFCARYDEDGTFIARDTLYAADQTWMSAFDVSKTISDSDTRFVRLCYRTNSLTSTSCTIIHSPNTYDKHIEYVKSLFKADETENLNTNVSLYFSSGDQPTFFERISGDSTKVAVCFPPYADVRLYKKNGQVLLNRVIGDEPYTLSNMQKLVYNPSTSALEIKAYTADASGCAVLLALNGNTVSGLLKPYYDTWKSNIRKLSAIKNVIGASEFKCLFFSDIHGASRNFKRIIRYANINKADFNAVINGGDTVQANMGEGLAWYNAIVADSEIDVLNCVGNHDAWVSDWELGEPTDIYDLVTKEVVTTVEDVVQPSDAEANGLTYYYKDYSNVRVIVLSAMVTDYDTMLWDSAQNAWLQNVLADAKSNGKAVLCVNHAPFKASYVNHINSKWNSYIKYESLNSYDGIHTATEAIESVQSFINNGGTFIAWLSGHIHFDNLITADGYSGQIMINIASAKYSFHGDGFHTTNEGDSCNIAYDCFNAIGVDTDNSFIKVYRVGFNTDYALNVRDYLCYDYANKKLIAE